METKALFDPNTYTLTYVVFDPDSRDAVVIDPVMDLDPLAWRVSTTTTDQVRAFVAEKSLRVRYVLETHAHADHLSGMQPLREAFGAPTAIGENITVVQSLFAKAFHMPGLATDGSQWDELLVDGQRLSAGTINIDVIHTPGHTPACVSYRIGDAVYTGDALFMPDYGTGRCDFPNGSASDLYDSVAGKLYKLPDATAVFVGHDYLPNGRPLAYETTIGQSKEANVRLRATTSKTEFVSAREERDRQLPPPKLILPSLQVNIAAGQLPEPEANGRRYFKIPINFLGG